MSVRINNRFLIKTPNGYQQFYGIQRLYKPTITITHKKTGNSLTCTKDHKIKFMGKWFHANQLPNRYFKKINNVKQNVYDIIESFDHEYTTNGFTSHNCLFLGSGGTLIDGEVIERMVGIEPLVISDDTNSKMFKPPNPGHKYVITVDSAEGTGNDNSSISVFDVTVRPFELVFSFANNNIKPGDFAYKVHVFSLKYNNAYILVENNSIGALVCRELWQTYENEGLLSTDNKEAVTFSSINYGVRTTKRIKKTGCRVLKLLIEGEELVIPDDAYIEEISTFAKIGKTDTYAAIRGKKDDRVMTLVLFAWYTQTEFFKEDSSINIITSESQCDDDFFELPAFYQQNTTFAK